jgi:hypothetical protein
MLPFSPEVYLRLLEDYNSTIWPAQIIAAGLGCLALLLIFKPRQGSGRWIAALLAGAWVWTGAVYHVMYLAPLNWAAWISGALFVLQGGLLAWTGAWRRRLAFRLIHNWRGWIGLLFGGLALFALPIAGAVTDPGWSRVPVTGLASSPTTLFTLGLLLLVEGRVPIRLLLIPALWSFSAAATAWQLHLPQDLILPVAAIAAVGLAFAANRRLANQSARSI